MKNLNALALLTTALSLNATDTTSQTALQAWVDTHLPALITKAQAALKGGFEIQNLFGLAGDVVKAVQDLKGIVGGKDRAAVAQIVLEVVAKAALPDMVEPWILPLLGGAGVKALIESAFQQVFGPEKTALPPVSNPIPLPTVNDDTLGRPATDADFTTMDEWPDLK